jgi:hypothetical protein
MFMHLLLQTRRHIMKQAAGELGWDHRKMPSSMGFSLKIPKGRTTSMGRCTTLFHSKVDDLYQLMRLWDQHFPGLFLSRNLHLGHHHLRRNRHRESLL